MFFNYFKIAFRSLFKRKGYDTLNILGLVLGISCCLMIFQYVSFERSFDSQSLQEFAYRIHIKWWVFAIAGIGAALIALGTISFQAIKAIIANPVNSLRNE